MVGQQTRLHAGSLFLSFRVPRGKRSGLPVPGKYWTPSAVLAHWVYLRNLWRRSFHAAVRSNKTAVAFVLRVTAPLRERAKRPIRPAVTYPWWRWRFRPAAQLPVPFRAGRRRGGRPSPPGLRRHITRARLRLCAQRLRMIIHQLPPLIVLTQTLGQICSQSNCGGAFVRRIPTT